MTEDRMASVGKNVEVLIEKGKATAFGLVVGSGSHGKAV
jgi:hypothetical protein